MRSSYSSVWIRRISSADLSSHVRLLAAILACQAEGTASAEALWWELSSGIEGACVAGRGKGQMRYREERTFEG